MVTHAHTAYQIWCTLTFSLEPHSTQRQYKTITIPDDDILNALEQREVELTLGSTDPNVVIDSDAASAVVVVIDNESMF